MRVQLLQAEEEQMLQKKKRMGVESEKLSIINENMNEALLKYAYFNECHGYQNLGHVDFSS